jgi:hypothetical protein
MTALENPALRQLALRVLAQHAGSAPGTEALVAAVRRAYDDLARVAAPLIGQVGVDALTGRALHLAQRHTPWLVRTREPEQWKGPLIRFVFCLEQQDPAIATKPPERCSHIDGVARLVHRGTLSAGFIATGVARCL